MEKSSLRSWTFPARVSHRLRVMYDGHQQTPLCRTLRPPGPDSTARPSTLRNGVARTVNRSGQLCADTTGAAENFAGLSCSCTMDLLSAFCVRLDLQRVGLCFASRGGGVVFL